MIVINQAYRYALDPTPRQQRALRSHCGAARYAHNWALDLVKQRLDQRAAGREVELPWTLVALRREWNRSKDHVAPWWRENSKEAYNSGLDALAQALKNWSNSKHGRRKGPKIGFPHRKTKHRTRPSCRFTTGIIRVEPDRHHVVLPRLGRIRTHESTRKLARRLEAGTARILSVTVSCTADRWYASFTVEVHRRIPEHARACGVVGIDAGVRHLAVLSTGQVVPNPRPLEQAQRRLRRLNRQLARRHGPRAPDGTRRAPSGGWQQSRQRLARAHARVAHIRRDGLHKLTAELVARHGTVVVEHLNVAGMLRNRPLARRIADAGFGELRRQLAYKTAWAGTRLVQADTFYASSKTCSACGVVKAKLPLSARVFHCEACGLRIDRDLNAARNLAALVNELVAGSGPETRNARGADRKARLVGQVATKREASTEPCSGEAGTVGW
ncbi:MAG TPA: IS607 family element RNA-guided endonuclease TnpB [Actinomycetota bacterium]|jgi:putative transposase